MARQPNLSKQSSRHSESAYYSRPTPELPLFDQQLKIRQSKKEQIEDFFVANLGTKFGTSMLHTRFGTAVRTRISEINRDENSPIVIRQSGRIEGDKETSHYWSERRTA